MNNATSDPLASLIARVEGATGPDREIDADLMVAVGGARRIDATTFYGPNEMHWSFGEYEEEDKAWNGPLPYVTSSLDAALALVERCLPDLGDKEGDGWEVTVHRGFRRSWTARIGQPWNSERCTTSYRSGGDHPTPALAILSSLLKALQAQPNREEEEGERS